MEREIIKKSANKLSVKLNNRKIYLGNRLIKNECDKLLTRLIESYKLEYIRDMSNELVDNIN